MAPYNSSLAEHIFQHRKTIEGSWSVTNIVFFASVERNCSQPQNGKETIKTDEKIRWRSSINLATLMYRLSSDVCSAHNQRKVILSLVTGVETDYCLPKVCFQMTLLR
jgi:hypothetical protein